MVVAAAACGSDGSSFLPKPPITAMAMPAPASMSTSAPMPRNKPTGRRFGPALGAGACTCPAADEAVVEKAGVRARVIGTCEGGPIEIDDAATPIDSQAAWGSSCEACARAWANSLAEPKRRSGSFSSARRITRSIDAGRSRRSWRGGVGGVSRCWRRSSNSEGALNGGVPVAPS